MPCLHTLELFIYQSTTWLNNSQVKLGQYNIKCNDGKMCILHRQLNRLRTCWWKKRGKDYSLKNSMDLGMHLVITLAARYVRPFVHPSICILTRAYLINSKNKSIFTMLIYIPFLAIGEWYFK